MALSARLARDAKRAAGSGPGLPAFYRFVARTRRIMRPGPQQRGAGPFGMSSAPCAGGCAKRAACSRPGLPAFYRFVARTRRIMRPGPQQRGAGLFERVLPNPAILLTLLGPRLRPKAKTHSALIKSRNAKAFRARASGSRGLSSRLAARRRRRPPIPAAFHGRQRRGP